VKPSGFVLGGDLGENFRNGDSQTDGEAEFPLDLLFDLDGNRLVGGVERPSQAREIGEGLVDGVLLHLGCEAPDDAEHPLRKEAVGLVVRGKDDEIGADLPRLDEGDTAFDAELFGRVARAGHDPALTAGDQDFPLELRVDHLLAGGEEGVTVHVQNGPRPGVDVESKIAHK